MTESMTLATRIEVTRQCRELIHQLPEGSKHIRHAHFQTVQDAAGRYLLIWRRLTRTKAASSGVWPDSQLFYLQEDNRHEIPGLKLMGTVMVPVEVRHD